MSEQVLEITGVQVDHLMIAIPSQDVLAIERPKISLVPSTQAWLEGVTLYGDIIIPVINLCKVLNTEPRTSRFAYVVIGTEDAPLAVIGVSRVVSKFSIEESEVYPITAASNPIFDNVVGILKTKTADWNLFNINSFLSDERIKEIGIS